MNLYSESKGTSDSRGYARRVSSASTPSLAASTTSAASVGSPITDPSSSTTASLSRARPSAEPGEVGDGRAGHRQDRAGLAVALAFDGEPGTAGVQRGDHHLVQRQRAGLVGVDRAGRAERLDVGEVLHHRLRLGQLLGAERQQARDERRHARRDRRDGHRRAEQQQVLAPGSRGSGPTTTMMATAPHAMIPSTLVSESSSFCSGDLVRVTELSIVAIWPIWVCIPVAVTTIVPVPRVTEVFWNSMFGAVAERHVGGGQRTGVLGDRRALPGQRGLLRLQRRRPDDPTVGRHDVAGLDLDDVAGNDLGGLDQRDRLRRGPPAPAAPASWRARRRSPAPPAPGGCRARRSAR